MHKSLNRQREKKKGKTDKRAKAMVERDRNRSPSKKQEGERKKRKRRSYKDVEAVYLTAILWFTGTAPLARSQHVLGNYCRRLIISRKKNKINFTSRSYFVSIEILKKKYSYRYKYKLKGKKNKSQKYENFVFNKEKQTFFLLL
jgi:hypothetical protein